jgi:hypothetical protein
MEYQSNYALDIGSLSGECFAEKLGHQIDVRHRRLAPSGRKHPDANTALCLHVLMNA